MRAGGPSFPLLDLQNVTNLPISLTCALKKRRISRKITPNQILTNSGIATHMKTMQNGLTNIDRRQFLTFLTFKIHHFFSILRNMQQAPFQRRNM